MEQRPHIVVVEDEATQRDLLVDYLGRQNFRVTGLDGGAPLRRLVERVGRRHPIVALDTNLALDEHFDYVFQDVPGLMTLDGWMTPQNNLAVQTEVIRRATRFVGTCGSLAWLAPMLGTDTLAIYADDHFLTPHLYAARHAYASMDAAPFTPMDLAVLNTLDLE